MMRWVAWMVAVLPVCAQDGVVEGTVTDALSKAPVAEAVVRLYRGEKAVHNVMSDAQGIFKVEGLAEGSYHVEIQSVDHLSMAVDHPAARPFLLSAANKHVRLRVELIPLGGVAGRILNPEGEPVKGAPVAMRRLWDVQWTQISTTDDKGLFRFARLEPGAWILAGLPTMKIMHSDPAKNPKPIAAPGDEEGQRVGWAATFFPGVLDLPSADKIVVRPGAMMEGYDIKLRTTPLRRVSGLVLDEQDKPVPKAALSFTDVVNKGSNGVLKAADGEGRFEVDAVPDGEWRVFAQAKRGEHTLKGFAELRVSRRDVSGVRVQLQSPFAVRGMVEREEPRDQEGKRKVTVVHLIPEGASADVQESTPHAQDGSFVLKNVYAGQYRVLSAGYVPGYYVASIWYGEQEVTTQPVTITSPPLALKIVYRSGAGSASGTVERGQGSWVVLVPQDEALRDAYQFIRTAKCGEFGKFSIDSLRPGSYYAFAFDRVRREMLEDPEFVRRLAPQALRVEIRHGEAATLELRPQVWPDY